MPVNVVDEKAYNQNYGRRIQAVIYLYDIVIY